MGLSKTFKHKIAIIFLSISLNMCFWVLKRTVSFEYPQHMFWLRNKKNNFQLRTLIWGPVRVMVYLSFEIQIFRLH